MTMLIVALICYSLKKRAMPDYSRQDFGQRVGELLGSSFCKKNKIAEEVAHVSGIFPFSGLHPSPLSDYIAFFIAFIRREISELCLVTKHSLANVGRSIS